MLREHLYHRKLGADRHFRWRGGDVSRIEGISDGVFAITIALLIVSATSTSTFYEIWKTVRDLPAFLMSFLLICYAWFEHYIFFRRYGLEDGITIVLNFLFLFLIMFLAFPLKFLTTFLWYLIIGEPLQPLFVLPEGSPEFLTNFTQARFMMLFYGAALLGVFVVLALMQWRAYALRVASELDAIEIKVTRESLRHHIISAGIAVLSIVVLIVTDNPMLSGLCYVLMPIIHIPLGIYESRELDKKIHAMS